MCKETVISELSIRSFSLPGTSTTIEAILGRETKGNEIRMDGIYYQAALFGRRI